METYDYRNQADTAIEPVLKEFAKMTFSVLTIEKPSYTHIIATLANSHGFEITDSYKLMKNYLMLADHIGINTDNQSITLTLIYEYS